MSRLTFSSSLVFMIEGALHVEGTKVPRQTFCKCWYSGSDRAPKRDPEIVANKGQGQGTSAVNTREGDLGSDSS